MLRVVTCAHADETTPTPLMAWGARSISRRGVLGFAFGVVNGVGRENPILAVHGLDDDRPDAEPASNPERVTS
jgi:hypothetical protein